MGGDYVKYVCKGNCITCLKLDWNYCVSCKNDKYAFKGDCVNICQESYKIYTNEEGNQMCLDCYSKCESCITKGNADDMKCTTCPENMIKYDGNCYEIVNNIVKSFINPADSQESSCLQLFGKYIINGTNECIDKPDGYYISNETTGLLSPCYQNCETCESGEERNSEEKLINMKCTSCGYYNMESRWGYKPLKMIKVDENCFPPKKIDTKKITFDISSMYSGEIEGTCKFFNKSIYEGSYECKEKPENTYYVKNNEDNTGVIRNCHKACKTCEEKSTHHNTMCQLCAENYSHSSSDSSPPYNCYKNGHSTIINCYYTCSSCEDEAEMDGNYVKNQNCDECIDNYYKMAGTNDCIIIQLKTKDII